MKKLNFGLIALSASLLATAYLLGQSGATVTPPAAAAPKQQKLLKVATLGTVEQNREFQNNVQLLQAQRQAVIDLGTQHDKETDAKKKKDLKTQLDALLAKLNDNNQKMIKAYGFSLERNYTLVIETAHVYMLVSDEEAAKVEKAEQEKAKAAPAAKK